MDRLEQAKLVAYLRRQGGQCNKQQPIVPVAGSELLKAADLIEALSPQIDVERLLEKHIQLCRDAAAECSNWSPAQAEWSRARDTLLNFQHDFRAVLAKARGSTGDGEEG